MNMIDGHTVTLLRNECPFLEINLTGWNFNGIISQLVVDRFTFFYR